MQRIKITDEFSHGCTVKTQIQDSTEWISNVVINIYPDTEEIDVLFDDRYKNMLILVGDAIKVNYLKDEQQYLMETWVTAIKSGQENVMTLKIISTKKMANTRREERYSVNYGAHIASFEKPEGAFGVITNISLIGIGFIIRETFGIGEIVNIAIYLPSKIFEIDAEIVRYSDAERGIEYGASFIKKDEDEMAALEKLIEDIKEREDRLSRIVGFDKR